MASQVASESGLFGALRNIAATLLGTLQTRLALLGNEVELEKRLVLQQLALGLALVFCVGLSLLLAVGLAVHVWWEHRVWVLAGSASLFLAISVYLYVALRRTLTSTDKIFGASLAELQEDLRQLKAATGHNSDHG